MAGVETGELDTCHPPQPALGYKCLACPELNIACNDLFPSCASRMVLVCAILGKIKQSCSVRRGSLRKSAGLHSELRETAGAWGCCSSW